MEDLVQRFSPEEYIALLPPTSRGFVANALSADIDPMVIAGRLADLPADGLAPKGGTPWTRDLFQKVMREMHLILCTDDPKYSEIRSQLRGEGATTARVLLYVLTTAVAAAADMAVALCIPLTTTILAAISKAGLTVWCQSFSQNP